MSDRIRDVLEYAGLLCLVVAAGLAWGPGASIAVAGIVMIAEANLDRDDESGGDR